MKFYNLGDKAFETDLKIEKLKNFTVKKFGQFLKALTEKLSIFKNKRSSQLIHIKQGRLQKPQFMKIPIYIGYIRENAFLMKYFVILPNIP